MQLQRFRISPSSKKTPAAAAGASAVSKTAATTSKVEKKLPEWEITLRKRVTLSQKACHATLVATMLGVPPLMQQQHQAQALNLWGNLYVESFYSGDSDRCATDNAFYLDGSALVVRDFKRRGHLLLPFRGKDAVPLTPEQQALRDSLRQDAYSLLGFAFLAMNTFPFTPAVLGTLLHKAPWLPRNWVLPSQFEQRRLDGLRRTRRLGSMSIESSSDEEDIGDKMLIRPDLLSEP